MLDNELKFNNKTVEIITGTNPDASIVDSRVAFYYAVYKACTGNDYTGDNAEIDALNELINLYTGNNGSGNVIDDWITFCINAIEAYDETVRSYSLIDLKYQLFELFKDIGLQLVPDYIDLQQWLEGYSGPDVEDYIGTLDAKLVYSCPEILTDTAEITLDTTTSGVTVSEVNGSSTTTGVTLSGDTISFDYSELPEARIWQIKLSNGSEYHLQGSTRLFDISGNGNHATLSGTLDVDYQWSQQSEFDPYAKYGFNKAWRCASSGFISIPSEQAYGTWEFGVTMLGSALGVNFISDTQNTAPANTSGYDIRVKANNSIALREFNAGELTEELFNTAASYVQNNTPYEFKIYRNSTTDEYVTGAVGTFAVYIKSPTDTNFPDWTLVDTTGGDGTNPVTDNTHTTSNFIVADLDAGDIISGISTTDTDGNVRYLEPSDLDWETQSGSFEIIDIPEDRSNTGYDVLGAAINYRQDGNTILNAEGCQIDFDPEDSEDSKLDIYDRDNDTLHDTDISQNGDYDSSYPYRWSVWEMFDNNDFAAYLRAGKLRLFNQTVENDFPIGVRRFVNYDDQRGILSDSLNVSLCENDPDSDQDYDTFTNVSSTGFTATKTNTDDLAFAGTADEIDIKDNEVYHVTFDASFTGDAPSCRLSNRISGASLSNTFVVTQGANELLFFTTGSDTGVWQIFSQIADTLSITISDLAVRKVESSDTTTITRLSNYLNTPSIADQATAYDSDLYIETSVRTSVLNQDRNIADIGYIGDDLLDGWDFTSGWNNAGGVTIVDNNTFTSTISGGLFKAVLTVGKRYMVTLSGSTSAIDIGLRNSNGQAAQGFISDDFGTYVFTATSEYIYIRNEGAGTTNITTFEIYEIGDTVGEVIDLSGNTTVTQTDETKQPILTVDGLKFDGVDDQIDFTDVSLTGAFEITVKAQFTGSFLGLIGDSTSNDSFIAFSSSGTAVSTRFADSNITFLLNTTLTIGDIYAIKITRDSSNVLRCYLDDDLSISSETKSGTFVFNVLGQTNGFLFYDGIIEKVIIKDLS